MKAARLYSATDIRIETLPIPKVGRGEALMKTIASGICSGDLMPWYIEKKAPLVLGHEPSGVIVRAGKDVRDFRAGDRVFVHHHAPCLEKTCKPCARGEFVHCPAWKASSIIPGGISEYILIPEINLKNDTLKLPDTLSCEDGVLVEPLACVLKGLKKAASPRGDFKGDTVLVIGLGVMGALHILALKALGAERIIGAETNPWRANKAKELGARDVFVIDASRTDTAEAVSEMTSGAMADLVVVGPNSAHAMAEGIKSAGNGARVIFFTPARPGEELLIDPSEIYFKEITLIPSYSAGPEDTRQALRMIESGAVRAGMVITHRFPIEETAAAYNLASMAGESLKTIITFPP